jgi:capA domain protein
MGRGKRMKNWKDLLKGWKGVGKDILTMFNEWLDVGLEKVTAIHLTNEQFVYGLLITVFAAANVVLWVQKFNGFPITATEMPDSIEQKEELDANQIPRTARIMANGDQLYHDLLYMSAAKEDGSYDFSENYRYAKSWLKQADLVLGDFEGTINPNYYLAGYPLFNAPESVVDSIKKAGYQVMDLGHNHILDSGLEGVFSTAKAFEDAGIQTVGVYPHETRDQAPLLIKEVNGIKIAILAYSYGFNGLEAYLDQEDYDNRLSDLNEERMRKEIQKAETEADLTIVMPQMGIEYDLEPTEEQKKLYHKMISWGADIVFGGHPHVVQPSEIVDKDGQQKLIIYSMGNFLSNQRIETMEEIENAQWTERGVLMDVTVEKVGRKTRIKTAKAHPTWVSRTPKGTYSPEGYELYHYQTYILEDWIEGGKYREKLDEDTKDRVDAAYQEMKEHVHLDWK